MIPSAARGRSHSMRPLIHRGRIRSNINPQTVRLSSSSWSTTSSMSDQNTNTKTEPMATTNTIKRQQKRSKCKGDCALEEVKLRETSVLDEAQRTRSVLDINLRDASTATNIEHLDPTRDGVYARVKNALRQYSIATGSGSALTIAGFHALNYFNNTETSTIRNIFNNNTQIVSMNSTVQQSSNQTDYDGVINPLSK